jgi:hypothetical protein
MTENRGHKTEEKENNIENIKVNFGYRRVKVNWESRALRI